jgi:hypothetical protein
VQKICDCHAFVQVVDEEAGVAAKSGKSFAETGHKKSAREASAFSRVTSQRSEADGCPRDATNVAAADAEIVEFTITHAVQFGYGLAVLAPVVELACDVHDNTPSVRVFGAPQRRVKFDGLNLCCAAKW